MSGEPIEGYCSLCDVLYDASLIGGDCEMCGEPVDKATVTPCEVGDACDHDDHHYGENAHVTWEAV